MAAAPAALQIRHPAPAEPAHASDEELVERLRAGDEAAFRMLVARHRPWLVRLGTRLLGNDRHAAEDLAQEALLKLHAAARRNRRPLRVRPWLSVVARNASLDEHRKRHPELPGRLPEPSTTNDGLFVLDAELSQAWSALGGRHREVLYLRELHGLSYREIATVMELSDSAVETLLFRARAALRREYERAGGSRFGCGVLGLGLYRFADGQRGGLGGTGAHVAGCDACGRAADALRAIPPAAGTGVTGPGAGPTGRVGAGAPNLNLAPVADLARVPPSLWTSLSTAEPFLAKVVSAGVALAAAVIPVVVTAALTNGPAHPPAAPSTASSAGASFAAPFPSPPRTAIPATSSAAGAPVVAPPTAVPAGVPPAGEPAARPGPPVPFDGGLGAVAPPGGDRLSAPVVAPDLAGAPKPPEPLPERRAARREITDELRSTGALSAVGALPSQPVSERPRPRPRWLAAYLGQLIGEATVPEPSVPEATGTAPAAAGPAAAEPVVEPTGALEPITGRPGPDPISGTVPSVTAALPGEDVVDDDAAEDPVDASER